MCSNSQKTTSIARPSCSHFAKRAQCEFQKKRDFVSGHQTRSLNFPMLLEHPHAFHAFLRFQRFPPRTHFLFAGRSLKSSRSLDSISFFSSRSNCLRAACTAGIFLCSRLATVRSEER